MTVQKRLLVIFLLLFAFFSIGVVLYFRIEHTHLTQILKERVQERKLGFEKVLKLEQQAIFVLAKDYSYWGELVDAIKKEDVPWAQINIDSAIKTYQADAAWVYNMDFKKIYSVNRFGDARLKDLPLSQQDVEKIFSGQALAHFYIETSTGYLEVQGATVHPSDDSERKTSAQGYFFVGELWDRDHQNVLAQLTSTKVSVLSAKDAANAKLSNATFTIAIEDWKKAPLFSIVASIDARAFESFQKQSRLFLKMFILYTSLQMLVLLYFLRRFFRKVQSLP